MFGHPGIELLSRKLDGMLEPKSASVLEQHLRICSDCQGKLVAFAQVKKTIQALPVLAEGLPRQVPIPVFVPVETSVSLTRNIALGFLVGIGFLVGLLLFRPTQPAMRIISSSPQLVTSAGILQPFLESDTALRAYQAKPTGHVDLEIPGQLLLRLKPGTMVTWQQVNRPLLGSRPHIVVNLMRGELVARTQESFWGSRLEVRTPAATSLIKGTAFALKVDPSRDSTTLKVLAGSVFFSPYLGKVGVQVGSGQMSQIQAARLPEPTKPLSSTEKQALLEAYRIGQDPVMALVIGEGSERVEELLQPALFYLSRRNNPELQPFLRKAVDRINSTILEGADLSRNEGDLKVLEMAVKSMKDREKAIPLRLFLGACTARLGDVSRARLHFYWVVETFPSDSKAPLALAAVAVTAERQLGNLNSASGAYQNILARYPKSPEADLARNFLKKHSR